MRGIVIRLVLDVYVCQITVLCTAVRRDWKSYMTVRKLTPIQNCTSCAFMYTTHYCTCSPTYWLSNIHRTFRPLHPNQFFSSSGRIRIDSIYVATHQEWHLWRGGSSMPSVALSNSYSHPWHRKDSWWVVRWLGAQSQSTLESIDRTKRKLSCLSWNIMEIPFFLLLFHSSRTWPRKKQCFRSARIH